MQHDDVAFSEPDCGVREEVVEQALHREGRMGFVGMLARLPENRAIAGRRHRWIGDDQLPVFPAAVARPDHSFFQMRVARQSVDDALVVRIGIRRI